jgi:hypothetical protein
MGEEVMNIVERLRDFAHISKVVLADPAAKVLDEAADTIETLRARLWNYETGTAGMCADAAIGAAKEWMKEVETLRARVKELEACSADASRWRAIKFRHSVALCRLATGSVSYSNAKAPALLDAWADMASAEIEAFDPEKYMNEEIPERLKELRE